MNPTQADEAKALATKIVTSCIDLLPTSVGSPCSAVGNTDKIAGLILDYTADLRTQLAERDAQLAAVRGEIAMDLLPCPFCGYTDCEMQYDGALYWVTCDKCSAEGPLTDYKHEAIRMWNTRQPTQDKGE